VERRFSDEGSYSPRELDCIQLHETYRTKFGAGQRPRELLSSRILLWGKDSRGPAIGLGTVSLETLARTGTYGSGYRGVMTVVADCGEGVLVGAFASGRSHRSGSARRSSRSIARS